MDFISQAELNVPQKLNKRNHSRTIVGAGTVVEIEFQGDRNDCLTGLVYDGSHGGCGIVAVTNVAISVNQLFTMTMGDVGPVTAQVRWVKDLEPRIVRFGVEYLI